MNGEQKIESLDLSIYKKPTELPPYPVDASGWGKNSYYHHCELTNQRKNFSVCSNIKRLIDNNSDIPAGYEQCAKAIAANTCPALAMRQQEIAAGRALFYMPKLEVNLEQPVTKNTQNLKRSSSKKLSSKSQERLDHIFSKRVRVDSLVSSKPKKSHPLEENGPMNMDLGAILGDVLQDEKSLKENSSSEYLDSKKATLTPNETTKSIINNKEEKKPKPSIKPSIKRLKNESPLAFAKRKLAASTI